MTVDVHPRTIAFEEVSTIALQPSLLSYFGLEGSTSMDASDVHP